MKEGIYCFFKFSTSNHEANAKYNSWKFIFSEEDKERLKSYYDKNYPVFIYLLCAVDTFRDSEIAICTYEELSVVKDKQTITIGRESSKSYFNLHIEKQRSTAIHLKRKPIEMNSDTIIDEIVNFSPEHYKSKVKEKIIINITNLQPQKKHYNRAISGQNIRYLSLSYRDDNICPIHNVKMPPLYVHIGKMKDTAYYCSKCGKYMIPSKRYSQLVNNLGKTSKTIEFKAIVQDTKEQI